MKLKYRGITVPYEYFDKKRNYTYYIYKDKEYHDLNKLFKAFIGSYLTYHFEVKEREIEVHNLSEVLENLIKFPDTFKIPTKYKAEYSTLEYEYIKCLIDALKNNTLKVNYNTNFNYSKNDFKSVKIYKFSKEIDRKYNDVIIPKRIKDRIFNNEYYVVGGVAYESIYHALDVVYDKEIHYIFGGTKNPNNRTHQKAHNFDDLISLIFKKSTKFIIHVFQQEYYSKQEIEFLKLLANKINELGFKSIEPKYEEEYREDNQYLNENKFLNYLKNKRFERKVLKSHKI